MQTASVHANSLTRSIFLNPSIIKSALLAENGMASFPVNSLIEALVIGTDFSIDKVKDLISSGKALDIIKYLCGSVNNKSGLTESSHGDWKKFGVYNTGACRYMAIRSEFVAKIKNESPWLYNKMLSSNMKKHELEKISQHQMVIDYPNIAWSIKVLALNKGWNDYSGIQANTTPCRKATEFLFNKSYNGDQFGHTLLCQKISIETGLSMMNANTVLWAIGSKL